MGIKGIIIVFAQGEEVDEPVVAVDQTELWVRFLLREARSPPRACVAVRQGVSEESELTKGLGR